MKRYKQSQKFRIIIDGVHLFTTAKQIRSGIGDEYRTNASVQKALDALEFSRFVDTGAAATAAMGIAGRWESKNVQIDVVRTDVAPSKKTKKVKNLMTGELVDIDVDTPHCCDPSTETFWSM